MMKFDVQSLVDRESAERGREFGEWAAACGRNRERMQEIGETAAGAAYQISVGGCGRAEMWLYVDSDEKCVRVQELLRPFAQGEMWHELKGGDVPTCYADFSDGLIVWIKVKEFE
ncbi:MAG: hypothetical protein ACFNVM_07790 [Neisseria elongata]|jgi:replication protein A protein|uniref:hypothetical protein n=1 Tax=Neisseria elongata TaxID=495 RepID=UPI0028ECEF06|nr:hypothetical protein [Neisseria elongata]